jgi:SAM-dependent methyltransferase
MTGTFVPGQFSLSYGAKKTEPQTVPQPTVAARPRIPFEGCPLCDSRGIGLLREADCSGHPLFHPIVPRAMKWMRCADCRHVFTDGFFDAEACSVIFGKTHDNQKPGADFERQRFVSARIVDRVAKFVRGGAWLDVGFGNGSLLFTADEWGFAPVGLDLRPQSVEAMSALGIEAHCVDLKDFDRPGTMAVISMADVLEHMPYPQEALRSARRLLRADGVVFLSMPNFDCMAWRLLDRANANPYWLELEHYHNFSRERLFALLEQNGFAPVDYGVSERYRVCMEVIARPKPD